MRDSDLKNMLEASERVVANLKKENKKLREDLHESEIKRADSRAIARDLREKNHELRGVVEAVRAELNRLGLETSADVHTAGRYHSALEPILSTAPPYQCPDCEELKQEVESRTVLNDTLEEHMGELVALWKRDNDGETAPVELLGWAAKRLRELESRLAVVKEAAFNEDYTAMAVIQNVRAALSGDFTCPRCVGKDKQIKACLDLLAILNGDGGHYTGDHGILESAKHAEKRFYAITAEKDKQIAGLTARVEEALSVLMPNKDGTERYSMNKKFCLCLDILSTTPEVLAMQEGYMMPSAITTAEEGINSFNISTSTTNNLMKPVRCIIIAREE